MRKELPPSAPLSPPMMKRRLSSSGVPIVVVFLVVAVVGVGAGDGVGAAI